MAEPGGHDRRLDVSGRPMDLRPVDLDRFFSPRRVAVVGASDTPGRSSTTMWHRVQRLAQEVGDDIAELDANPVLVTGTGAVVADALVVPRRAVRSTSGAG